MHRTPLHWACKRGHRNIVQRLLHHGADANLMTAKGESCLQMTENQAIIALLGGKSKHSIYYLDEVYNLCLSI